GRPRRPRRAGGNRHPAARANPELLARAWPVCGRDDQRQHHPPGHRRQRPLLRRTADDQADRLRRPGGLARPGRPLARRAAALREITCIHRISADARRIQRAHVAFGGARADAPRGRIAGRGRGVAAPHRVGRSRGGRGPLRPPCTPALLAHPADSRRGGRGRGRAPGSVRPGVPAGRTLRRLARRGGRVAAHDGALPGDRPASCPALARRGAHRRGAGVERPSRRAARRSVRAAGRGTGAPGARGARGAAAPAAVGHRAGVLRGAQSHGNRHAARAAARHRQDAHPSRPAEAARRAGGGAGMSMHEELKANAAGYVLGSLDANDRQEFEAHLAGCAECAAEVASLRPVVSVLATTVPQVTPRAEVRDRILGVAAGLKPSSAGAGPPAPRRLYALHDRKAPPALVWLPLAAAIVIAVGAGIYALRLQRQVGALQARFDQAQSTTAVLAAPDLARIDLQGQAVAPDARARALWSRSRGLVFTAANLPPAPAGKTYQVWVV